MHSRTVTTLHWHHYQHIKLSTNCPVVLHNWLRDRGSLTARLLCLSKGDFRVDVLFQGCASIRLDERQLLGLSHPTAVLVREVILYGHNQPWVFARSLMPLSSLTGRLRQLRKASRKPLGAFLFKQPNLIRSPLMIGEFKTTSQIVSTKFQQNQPLWGRSSVFYVDQKPLLISEVFLPDFIKIIS